MSLLFIPSSTISMKCCYTFGERERILQFVSSAQNNPQLSELTISQLLDLACPLPPVPHVNTYLRWKREQLSHSEYQVRSFSRGRPRKLSELQEQLLIGYACDRRRALQRVTQADLIDFAHTHLDAYLTTTTITDITKRAGFTSQRAMKRESRLTTEKVVDDSIAFLKEVRSYNYDLDRIIIMDETGIWSNVLRSRTLHPVNAYATSVLLFFCDFTFSMKLHASRLLLVSLKMFHRSGRFILTLNRKSCSEDHG